MKKIMLLLGLSLILGGCHVKNESNKDEGQQNAPTADSTLSTSDTTTTTVKDDDIMDISEMPSTAKRLDNHFQYAVYTNEERVMEDYDNAIVYSIWLWFNGKR